jgi:hypothetical protein
VVERRQASAPDSGGRRKPPTPWREPHPFGAALTTVRLPAFRFLFSFFLPFVIAGLDPAIHAAARLVQIFRC